MTAKDGTQRGGAQPGAGRKPGHRFTRETALLAHATRSRNAAQRVDDETSVVSECLRLHVRGWEPTRIAHHLSRHKTTIKRWITAHQDRLPAIREELRQSAKLAFDPLLEDVMKAFGAALVSDDGSLRLRAASDIADRYWGRAGGGDRGSHDVSVSVTYVSTSPGQAQPVTVYGRLLDPDSEEPSSDG